MIISGSIINSKASVQHHDEIKVSYYNKKPKFSIEKLIERKRKLTSNISGYLPPIELLSKKRGSQESSIEPKNGRSQTATGIRSDSETPHDPKLSVKTKPDLSRGVGTAGGFKGTRRNTGVRNRT